MQDMAGTPARPIVGQVGSRHEDAMLHPCRAIFTPPPPPIEGSRNSRARDALSIPFLRRARCACSQGKVPWETGSTRKLRVPVIMSM